MYYNTFILWQVLYPIGCLTLYGLTERIINEWMNETTGKTQSFDTTTKIKSEAGQITHTNEMAKAFNNFWMQTTANCMVHT
jgi:hypothetical protein